MDLSYSATSFSNDSVKTPLCPEQILRHKFDNDVISVVILVFSAFALLSNVSFLITVKKTNCLGKSISVHFVALSFVDISISISYISFALRWFYYLANRILTVSLFCSYFFRFPLQVLASMLVVSVTADRYRAVARPIETAASGVSWRLRLITVVTILTCLMTSLVSIVISITLFDMTYDYDCVIGNDTYAIFEMPKPYRHVFVIIQYFMAHILVIVDVISIVTSVGLLALIKKMLAQAPDLGMPTYYQTEQRNVTRMITANTTVFLLCILFHDLMWLANMYRLTFLGYTGHNVFFFVFTSSLSSLINSGVNPVIYNIFSVRFRHAFLNTFPCLRCSWWRRNGQGAEKAPMTVF